MQKNKIALCFLFLLNINVSLALQPDDFVHANALDKSCNFNSMGQYDIVRCVSKTFLMESEKFKK